ncbi:MAG: hypothetical protein KDD39_06690 [Bdellovibrionales bacterium]|nr:hypothetical protein [Bdellovibrionales bacterium]
MQSSCFRKLVLFSVLLTALFQSPLSYAPDDDAPVPDSEALAANSVPTQCAVPSDLQNIPALRDYVIRICQGVARVMDHKTGAGTGQLAADIETLRTELVGGAEGISSEDLASAGLTYESLRKYVNESTDSQGQVIQVMAYRQAIEKANAWLEKSGLGFFRVEQHPKAAVLEAFRNATAKYPSQKGVTQDDVKKASDFAYAENGPTEIRIPVHAEALADPNLVLKFSRYHLIADANVPSVDDHPLSAEVDPLPHEQYWYRRMQAARFGITVGVMLAASYAAGGVTPDAIAVFLAGLGLEAQFIGFSKYWRKFWAWGGFYGNAFVNFSYGAILASVKHLTEAIQGGDITFNQEEFLIRTGVLGATFIAAFGGMQVVSARMKNEGELSEGRAMYLESYGNIINNFGRFFATVAGMMGTSAAFAHIGSVPVDTNTVVGWGIQGVFFALVTAPLWFKRLVGDGTRAGLVAYDLHLHKDPKHPYNMPVLGRIRRWCAEGVAAISRLYTPRRVPKSVSK